MGTPIESHLDELALRATIDDDGHTCLVTIPDAENLSLQQMNQILARTRQLQAAQSLDIDGLEAALRDVTPPLDPEEENELTRRLEDEARQVLESDGCPPCYPPGTYMYENSDLPEECREIVGYWQSFGRSRGELPLRSQLEDWNQFRAFQRWARAGPFDIYERRARERRQRHGYDGDVRFTKNLQQQSPLERWIEFQTYQLRSLERMEEKRDREVKRLAESRLAEDVARRSILAKRAECDVTRHMKLLRWIQQQRQTMMDLGDNPTASSDNADTANPRAASARALRKRTLHGNLTLGSGETSAGVASARRSRQPPSISSSDGHRDGDPDGDSDKAGLTNGLATSTVSRPPPLPPIPSSSSTCAFKTPIAGHKNAVPGEEAPDHVPHIAIPYTATTRRGRKRRKEMDAGGEKEGRPIKIRNTRTASGLHQPRTNVGPLRQTVQNPTPPVATDPDHLDSSTDREKRAHPSAPAVVAAGVSCPQAAPAGFPTPAAPAMAAGPRRSARIAAKLAKMKTGGRDDPGKDGEPLKCHTAIAPARALLPVSRATCYGRRRTVSKVENGRRDKVTRAVSQKRT